MAVHSLGVGVIFLWNTEKGESTKDKVATASEQAEPQAKAELIRHLSSDIQAASSYISTIRSRMAFTVMIGPFVVLGAIAFRSGNPIKMPSLDQLGGYAAGLYVVYVFIALSASYLDFHASQKCNEWRTLIADLANASELGKPLRFEADPYWVAGFYLIFYSLTYLSFLISGYLYLLIVTR